MRCTVDSLYCGHCRDLELVSSSARVHNRGSLLQSNLCSLFFPGIQCCYQGVRKTRVDCICNLYTPYSQMADTREKTGAWSWKRRLKSFSELAECLTRIPPKITFYGLLYKYNYVGCLLLLMFSSDLLFAIKRDAYIFKETEWFCRFPKHQKLDKWAMAGKKRQTCWPKLHFETEYESQLTAIRWNRNINKSWWQEKKK